MIIDSHCHLNMKDFTPDLSDIIVDRLKPITSEINKLMKQLVGKTVIKARKDPADKRQVIYYYKRNILN
mgnify:CR=1 FL=1